MTGKPMRRKIQIFIIASGLILCLGVLTLARYVLQQRESGILTAQEFYFTSDFLKDASEKAEYYIDPGKASFKLEIRNYADAKRKTPAAIECMIEITNGSASVSNFVLPSTDSAKQITITPNADAAEFTVTAVSKKPYEKKLTAVFKRNMGNPYRIEDSIGNHAAALIMTCADDGKDITVQLPTDVIPDAGDHRMKKKNGNEYIFSSPGKGIYSITLMKTNTAVDLTADGKFADQITIPK